MEYRKRNLYRKANKYLALARENYELGNDDDAVRYHKKFYQILDILIACGWDKEYMGIA